MSNTPIDINYLVNEIENIMSEHSYIEAMYNDVFQNMEIDIPLKSCTEQWKNLLLEYKMEYDDFICNILMAVLSDICAEVSIKENIRYLHTSDKAIRLRQKKVVATKEKVYGDDLYRSQPYFENVKKRNLSIFYITELSTVLHEEISQSDIKDNKTANNTQSRFQEKVQNNDSYLVRSNPLLKLANSENINLEHFFYEDLNDIVEYYKSICKYITDSNNEMSNFQQMMILYHLEIETRFSTIFQMLKVLSDKNLNDNQKKRLYKSREICSKKYKNPVTKKQCYYQNLIYFGKNYYSINLADCCFDNNLDMTYILNPMYEIVKSIYTIRDTIMYRLKKTHIKNYDDFINSTFMGLQATFNNKKDNLSHYEQLLKQEFEKIIDEYKSFNSYDVKVEHFVRMYVSDDKFDKFQQSEKERKDINAERRKTKNKKSHS